MRKREGTEPRDENQLWMPTFSEQRKAKPEEPNAKVPEGPPGSETVARRYGKVGNSGDPINSFTREGRTKRPANREEVRRLVGSRMSS